MSPGATFERVYNELKRMLAEGELLPGSPIEPALIGKQIASSITPIRDALHRLTGERLVEAPNHNGFRVPDIHESTLRDLYIWNGQLLTLALRKVGPADPSHRLRDRAVGESVQISIAGLFVAISRASGNAEHVRAIEQLNARLAPVRAVEPQLLTDANDEYDFLRDRYEQADRSSLVRLIERYHRRRVRAVPELLVVLAASAQS